MWNGYFFGPQDLSILSVKEPPNGANYEAEALTSASGTLEYGDLW